MDGIDPARLTDDVEELKALCASLAMMLAERDAKIQSQEARLAERDASLADAAASYALLEARFLAALKRLYGPRADRLRPTISLAADLGQLLLDFAAALEARPVEDVTLPKDADPADARRVGAKPRGGRRRIADLEHLPVTVVEHDLPEAERACPCCGEARTKIGAPVEGWGELAGRVHPRTVPAVPPPPPHLRLPPLRRRRARRAGRYRRPRRRAGREGAAGGAGPARAARPVEVGAPPQEPQETHGGRSRSATRSTSGRS